MTTIGVDLGTSGCKAAAIRTDGTILSDAYQEYTPVLTPEGGHELDVEAVLAHAIQVIQQVASECGGEEIAALSVSSLGETVVPLDRNGSVLFPGILYSDPRGKELEEELIGRLDLDRFYRVTGYMPSRASSLCRIMWLKRYRPELYEQAVCFLPLNALLLHRLGAKAHIDFTLASTSQAFDIWKNRWDLNILSTAQIDPAKLPQAVPPGTTVGQMDKKIARELGLENTPLLVAGGHDQPCVSLGGRCDPRRRSLGRHGQCGSNRRGGGGQFFNRPSLPVWAFCRAPCDSRNVFRLRLYHDCRPGRQVVSGQPVQGPGSSGSADRRGCVQLNV